MVAYEAAASLDGLTLSAGDKTAILKGTRLDEVAKAQVGGVAFTPSALNHVEILDQLLMTAAGSTVELEPGKPYVAHVELKDGRTLKAPVTVDPPRPQIALLSKGVQQDAVTPLPVQFGSPDDLPIEGRLVFFLKSKAPLNFPRDEKVEMAAADSSFHTLLTLSDGGLMLEDAPRRWQAWNRSPVSAPRPSGRCACAQFPPKARPAIGCRWARWCASRGSPTCAARAP